MADETNGRRRRPAALRISARHGSDAALTAQNRRLLGLILGFPQVNAIKEHAIIVRRRLTV
jgi:hypothetical protein